ncbi:hypothetical protein LVDJXP189_1210027 [Flavobacterium psychrophilum]|nr:hypothetical protein CH1895_130045 [Flavobacterium psychrophilum]SNA75809.1 hypothetical protein FI055_40046 [Flavobacterium psychrophilum]SNB04716.1 hypothetical protein FI166_130041 [Flavobacterium psychrophilum]SNB30413.1 hypothetical protein LM01FP_90107 [Flavobacterium psychrophilum]SNB42155.1 hypothetical protein LVDJXP189_1210027 [Flavobacterium psychrophilum]
MKNIFNLIGSFMMIQALIFGWSLNYNTCNLKQKVAFVFILFLLGIFILIKNKK